MNITQIKKEFGKLAKDFGFQSAFGGWYKESSECIVVLELQKSNFGDYYQLNIKVFIQGAFGVNYRPNKDLIKSSFGHVNSGETQEFKELLDFDKPMEVKKRSEGLIMMFTNHIIPFTEQVLTKSGIKDLVTKEKLFLLPAVQQELDALT